MVDLSRRLRLLIASPNTKGDAARVLVATLDYAAEGERDALAIAAIETGRVDAVCAVIRRLHLFGRPVVEALTVSAVLDDAVERVLADAPAHPVEPGLRARRSSGRRIAGHSGPALSVDLRPASANAVCAIEACGRPALLHHLIPLLDSPLQDVADRAGQAFLNIIVGHLGESGRQLVSATTAKQIDEAAVAALESYPEHRNRMCLLAAAVACARPGPRLAAVLDDPGSQECMALRSAVRDLDEPLVRRNLLNWLRVPALAGQVKRWMHRLRTAEQFSDLLAHGHLLREPERRRALRRVDRPKQCMAPAAVAAQMNHSSQRWLPELVASLGLAVPQRIECLRDMIALPSPLARLRAANDLAALASTDDAARGALELFCFDRDRWVAQSAAMHALAPAHRSADEFLQRLIEADHPGISCLARLRLAKRSVAAFFDHWLDLSDHHRFAAAHRLIDNDRDAFIQRLRDRIALSPREERLAAIAIVRRLRLIEHVEEAILIQAASTDPRIASAAVACLAHAQHPRRHEAARAALRHAHPRVRANAVETIASFDDPPLIELVSPMMNVRENRVRANAIRAVMECKPDRAQPHLRSMLRDADPLHRVSALWVVKRSRISAVLDELAAMAIADPLELVRERAAMAKRSILVSDEAFSNCQTDAPLQIACGAGVRNPLREDALC